MMDQKEAKKRYAKAQTYQQNNKAAQILEKASEDLQAQFGLLNEAFQESEAKKQEVEKNYSQELQSLMTEMFQESVGELKNLEEKMEERNDKWNVTDERMKLFMALKDNLKRMSFMKR